MNRISPKDNCDLCHGTFHVDKLFYGIDDVILCPSCKRDGNTLRDEQIDKIVWNIVDSLFEKRKEELGNAR